MSTDIVHLVLVMDYMHLQQVLGEIASILHMANKEEGLHYVLHSQLFHMDVTLSPCMLKLVNNECWEKKFIQTVLTSWMQACCVQVLLSLLKFLWSR